MGTRARMRARDSPWNKSSFAPWEARTWESRNFHGWDRRQAAGKRPASRPAAGAVADIRQFPAQRGWRLRTAIKSNRWVDGYRGRPWRRSRLGGGSMVPGITRKLCLDGAAAMAGVCILAVLPGDGDGVHGEP